MFPICELNNHDNRLITKICTTLGCKKNIFCEECIQNLKNTDHICKYLEFKQIQADYDKFFKNKPKENLLKYLEYS